MSVADEGGIADRCSGFGGKTRPHHRLLFTRAQNRNKRLLLVKKTIGIAVAQRVESLPVDYGRTSAARASQMATAAGRRAGTVLPSHRAVVDIAKARRFQVAQRRWILAAGVHFAVGKQCDEIERRPTAKTGAA